MLTAAQAAIRLGVDRRTVTKWADEGKLPTAMRLPGATGARLFAAHAVDALATEQSEKAS